MRTTLQSLLRARYPALFQREPGSSPIHGDGWFNIIDALCSTLDMIAPYTEIRHIREQFGSLRFICWPTSEGVYGAIHTAHEFSLRIHESTGHPLSTKRSTSPSEITSLPSPNPNIPQTAVPAGLVDLVDIGFRFISKRSAARPVSESVQIETISWSGDQGLILTPSMRSIHATTIIQLQRAKSAGERRGFKGRIDPHLHKWIDRTNAASLFITQMSKRMDTTNGRCGPVDDLGNLL